MKKLIAKGVYSFEVIGEISDDTILREPDEMRKLIQEEFDESLGEEPEWKVTSILTMNTEVSEIEK